MRFAFNYTPDNAFVTANLKPLERESPTASAVTELHPSMCGIAGVLYADPLRPVDAEVLRAMGRSIAHRGPDAEGFLNEPGLGLVHRRLSIIDLGGGRQPLGNEDGSVQVVFNGEIYNFQELRRGLEARGHSFRTNSDTEVLVHLYEDEGDR